MGFASGSITFRRYRVSGPHPKTVDDGVIDALKRHAFGASQAVSSDGLEIGWIAPTHLFDTGLSAQKVGAGRFLHVVMRLDRTAAPPAVLRSYRRMEESAALKAAGKRSLSADDRRQAKDAAEARAAKEARQGSFRRISAHPMLFDMNEHTVYLASLGEAVHDKFRLLFANTFAATLVPLDAAELASHITQDAGHHRAYEDAVPVHLIDPPTGAASGNGSGDATDRSFLGREFLTWLWHEASAGDGTIPISADGLHTLPSHIAVMAQRIAQLDCDFHLTGRDVVYSDDPSAAPEARAALRLGKQPHKVGLALAADGETYELTLDALRMNVTGLKVPPSEEPDPAVRLEERCMHAARCAALLDGLYAGFLAARFGQGYSSKVAEMRAWALNGHARRKASASQTAEDAPLRLVR